MRSPKFQIKKSDIEQVINVSRLMSRWKDKVRNQMRKQLILDPIEHLDFHISINSQCASIATDVCSGTYIPQAPIRLLSEKSKGLCRQLVIPSIKDALILQTLADALWEELKNKSPSNKAYYLPNDHRFSQQHRGLTSEYGPIKAWLDFQKEILSFTKTRRFVVVTDIANYYDSISYDHLRNILADLSISKEHSLDLLIFILSHMLWQPDYMPRVQIGLPQINLDAARLLAHCFLFDIDKFLISKKSVDFTRFMDDIDIGVDSISDAKKTLRDLDLSLQTRQIRLNSGKTKILTQKDAENHFCVKENDLLDRFEARMEKRRKSLSSNRISKNCLSKSISRGLKNKTFSQGNGEKILKRCINYARTYQIQIKKQDFQSIMTAYPACREASLLWWQHNGQADSYLDLLRDFVADGHLIDDISIVLIANSLVSARLPANIKSDLLIQDICKNINLDGPWGLYAVFWIYSKYGNERELFGLIDRHARVWSANESLSRLVGGLYPRLASSKLISSFDGILQKFGNASIMSVVNFHLSLSSKKDGYRKISKFLEAPNKSLPNHITHSKFLMLLSLYQNIYIPAVVVSNLKSIHSRSSSDDYYSLILQGLGEKTSSPSSSSGGGG